MEPDHNAEQHADQAEAQPGWRQRLGGAWSELHERNALLRHLVHEPLFLAAVLFILLSAGGIALLLPKIWNAAPPGFSKIVRVSLLDYAQAWSLRRTARRAEAEGRWDDALAAWRGALANNLADTDTLRGTLAYFTHAPLARSANLGTVFTARDLLLELGRTNRTDALLIADVFERHRLADFALESLRPWASDLQPEEERVWMRALLTSGRVQTFVERWDRQPDRFASDPLLVLYRAAYDAGWGSVDRAPAAVQLLRSAQDHPSNRIVALRLLLAVSLQRENLEEYNRALERLGQAHSTMVPDYTAWWSLLWRHGRTEEAKKLAAAYQPLPPPTPFEAVQLARAWIALGLRTQAVALFHDHAKHYGMSVDVWATYLDLLQMEGNWNEVRRVSAELRTSASRRDDLLPISLYADIRADLAENRRTAVKEYLRRLRETEIHDAGLAVRLAAGLTAAEEYETAWEILRKYEKARGDTPEYWFEVLAAAQGRRDVPGLLQASERLLQFAPRNPRAKVMRLVALLATRTSPGEALALSLELTNDKNAASPALIINRAMALLLNHRAPEALTLLRSVAPDKLPTDSINAWRVAMADALAQTGQPKEALAIATQVNLTPLQPPQETWFRQLIVDLRKQAAAQAPSL